MRWIVILGLVFVGCDKDKGDTKVETPSSASPAPVKPAPPPEPSPLEKLLATDDFEAALEIVVPMMNDSANEIDPGARVFALWAQRRMKWTDVYVEKDETSLKLVKKDSDAARGKRLCYSGTIVQISKAHQRGERPLWHGILMTNRRDVIQFYAAGSSGELVDGKRARICAVVTGNYSYGNAGGGTTHAVSVVGMFKLPENIADAKD